MKNLTGPSSVLDLIGKTDLLKLKKMKSIEKPTRAAYK